MPIQPVYAQVIEEPVEMVVPEPATTTPPKEDYVACNCAAYLRTRGINIRGVDAKWFKEFPVAPPQVGGVVILKYMVEGEEVYHVSYIEEVRADSLLISESNYRRCQYTTRELSLTDEHIVKFWHP